jgi:predicted enzyme related to lactoylglutathione lyase
MKTAGHPFLGLRTVLYHAPDLAKAKAWYAGALGIQPYFDQPFYVGFNVGGFELGLHPGTSGPAKKDHGVVAYWGVSNADESFGSLLKLGAKELMAVQDVGEGIRVASVIDPFGNVFGLIENPHFKLSNA